MSIEDKQKYLQQEILDRGIDPYQFQDYCEKVKGEESDLESWSLDEIQIMVKSYLEMLDNQQGHSPAKEGEAPFNFDFSEPFAMVIRRGIEEPNQNNWEEEPQKQNSEWNPSFKDLDEPKPQTKEEQWMPDFEQKKEEKKEQADWIPAFEEEKEDPKKKEEQWNPDFSQSKESKLEFQKAPVYVPPRVEEPKGDSPARPEYNPDLNEDRVNEQRLWESHLQQEKQEQEKVKDIQEQQEKEKEKEASLRQQQQDFELSFQCMKLGGNLLEKFGELEIVIEGWYLLMLMLARTETKAGKLFQQSYIMYQICTPQTGWKVKRRYNDFIWLASILQKIYPGKTVPALVEKSITKNSANIVKKRKVMLQFFLNELLKTDEFKNSKFFVDFLRITDATAFNKVVKDSEKLQKPNQIQNLINTAGVIKFKSEKFVKGNCASYELLLQQTEPLYQKCKDLIKLYEGQLVQLSKTLNELGDVFGALSALSSQYDFTERFNQNTQSQLYISIKTLLQELSLWYQQENVAAKQSLRNFLRFQTINLQSLGNIFKLRTTFSMEADKRKDLSKARFEEDIMQQMEKKINRNKDLLEVPSKVGLVVRDEKQNLLIFREQYGYMNWNAENEAIKFTEHKLLSFANQFGKFCEEEHKSFSQQALKWEKWRERLTQYR